MNDFILSAHPPFHDPLPARVTSLLSRSPTHPDLHSPVPHTAVHVICTTRDVLWLDERMPGRDVLRWKHSRVGIEGKGSDTSLSLLEMPYSPRDQVSMSPHIQRIALHSRLHPQIDILTAEFEATCSPRTLVEPYSIPSPCRVSSAVDMPFSRSGLSFVQCVTGATAAGASSTADAMRELVPQDDFAMDTEDPTINSAQDRGDRLPPTCRLIEVGIAGQVYDRELVHASRAGSLEAGPAEADSEAMCARAETSRVDSVRPPPDVHASDAGRPAWVNRKTVDATALAATLQATAIRQLGDPLHDEPSEAEEDRDDLVERATRAFQSRAAEQGGHAVAASLYVLASVVRISEGPTTHTLRDRLELAASTRHSVEDDGPESDGPLPLTAGVATVRTARVARQLEAPLRCTAPAVLDMKPKDPPTSFDALISPSVAVETRPGESVLDIVDAARTILLPRGVEPDEPTLAPNQPQPVDRDPPPLHFSYLCPRAEDSDEEESNHPDGRRREERLRKRKGPNPSLDAIGARLLLAEWHVGADPRSYTWHNPYEGEKNKSLHLDASQVSLSRKARKKRDGTAAVAVSFDPSSQPSSSAQPPAFLPSSSFPGSSQAYFPSLAPPSTPARPPTSQFEPRLPASSSQDWTQAAATQPAISVTAPFDSPARAAPPFAGAASQVVPGAFGSRLSATGRHVARDKKKNKKRVSGF